MKQIPVIVDTDPGVGDVQAMVMALKNKKLNVKLVCSTAGNVNIEHTTKNMLYFVKMFSPTTKTARGVGKPLIKEFVDASDVHTENGLGGFIVPQTDYKVDYEDVVEGLYETILNCDQKITIITLGPVTNIASLLLKHPQIKEKIEKMYCMIGSINGTGNVTEYAEYNAFCDPDALKVLIESGIKMVFFPKQLGENTKILQKKFTEHKIKTEYHKIIKEMILGFNEKAVPSEYIAMYDEGCVYGLINSKMYNFVKCDASVDVKTKPGQTFLTKNESGKFLYATAKNEEKLAKALFKEVYKK